VWSDARACQSAADATILHRGFSQFCTKLACTHDCAIGGWQRQKTFTLKPDLSKEGVDDDSFNFFVPASTNLSSVVGRIQKRSSVRLPCGNLLRQRSWGLKIRGQDIHVLFQLHVPRQSFVDGPNFASFNCQMWFAVFQEPA